MTEEIRVNKNSPTEIDFNIQVEGINSSKLDVRFIIEQVNDFNLMLTATHIKDNEWRVIVPAFNKFDKNEFQMRIEVIADGYFFVPIKDGKLSVITDPVVSLTQEETKKETRKSQQKTSLEEASKKDMLVFEKQDKLQDSTKQSLNFKENNSKTPTRNIISNIINVENLKKINSVSSKDKNQKSLFFRAKNKKLIVPGLTEDKEYYKELNEKEKKVKQILKEIM